MIYQFYLDMFINTSIPNPGLDGKSINSWNSLVNIPSFTSQIKEIGTSLNYFQ